MRENTREGGRRRSRGGDRHEGRSKSAIPQLGWQQIKNPYGPMAIVSEDQLEAIHDASLDMLQEVGMDVLLPEAREIMKKAGADVDPGSERVRFGRELIEETIRTAPSEFTLHARNPERSLHIGGNSITFGCVASAPNSSDLDKGRRRGNFEDFSNLVRLSQCLNSVHFLGGYPVEPVDIAPNIRHLKTIQSFVKLTDKPFHAYSLGLMRNLDAIEMTRIARGITHEQLEKEPSLFTIINTNSPMKLDMPMLTGIIEMAKRNQPVVITPFTLSGAMAPVTLAGALAQQNAEALAGIAFTQMVRPGAPVMYGGFTSNVDMKSGAPAFGTPEYTKAAIIGGQLARRYRVPYRSSNVNASNAVDAQAAYESEMAVWGAVLGGCNFMMHGLGWLEGGLTASFEKVIIDAEILQMMTEFLKPLDINADTLALSAVKEVGPGGHFFGAQHTLERYETAFYAPMVSDWRNFQTWAEAGSPDATLRANRIWKALLEAYEPPPLDSAIRDELDAFVAKRIEEGGAVGE